MHWARLVKTAKYERGEEARLSALASRAAMDEQVFSLQAEVASLMRDKEDAALSLEHLRSSSKTSPATGPLKARSQGQSGQKADGVPATLHSEGQLEAIAEGCAFLATIVALFKG